MDVEVVREGGAAIFHVRGEMRYEDASAFARLIETAAGADPDEVVIDLTESGYLDEHGLSILLATRSFRERKLVPLVLIPGSRQVQRRFEMTGTRSIFKFRDPAS